MLLYVVLFCYPLFYVILWCVVICYVVFVLICVAVCCYMLFCNELHNFVLLCIVLWYTVLYFVDRRCLMSCHDVLCYCIFFCVVLLCVVVYQSVLFYVVSCYFMMYCVILCCCVMRYCITTRNTSKITDITKDKWLKCERELTKAKIDVVTTIILIKIMLVSNDYIHILKLTLQHIFPFPCKRM